MKPKFKRHPNKFKGDEAVILQVTLMMENVRHDRDGSIKTPAVIGAIIDLSYCFDLLDERYLKMLQTYYRLMALEYGSLKKDLPINKDAATDKHKDKLMRFLDCATIEFMHTKIRKEAKDQLDTKGYTALKLFDSVRGVFQEGGEAYPGAGITAKSHIQICIRHPNCIKGFFVKRDEIDFFKDQLAKPTTGLL